MSYENEEMEDIVLKEFKPNPKKQYPTILLAGKREAGKSVTSVAIAQMYNMDRWAAWCGTKDTEDFWADRFGSKATVFGADEKGIRKLHDMLAFQEKKVRFYKRVVKQPLPDRYKIGLVFDDVTAKRRFRKGEILEDLFSNGRHYKAVIIISCQYIKQLPPAVRTNTDYLFMLHNTKNTCEILHKEYVEQPPEFSMFLDLLRGVTSEKDEKGDYLFKSLVFNNCVKSDEIQEVFQTFCAPNLIWDKSKNMWVPFDPKTMTLQSPEQLVPFDPEKVDLGSPEWRAYNQATFVDHELRQDLKDYRKAKQKLRFEKYQTEHKARLNSLTPAQYDNDYFSDSGSESDSDSENSKQQSGFTIHSKRGKPINVKMEAKSATDYRSGNQPTQFQATNRYIQQPVGFQAQQFQAANRFQGATPSNQQPWGGFQGSAVQQPSTQFQAANRFQGSAPYNQQPLTQFRTSYSQQPTGFQGATPYSQQQPGATPYSQQQPTGFQGATPYSQQQPTGFQGATPYNQQQPTRFQGATPYSQQQPTGFQGATPYSQQQLAGFQGATPYSQQQPAGFQGAMLYSQQQPTGFQGATPYSQQPPTGFQGATPYSQQRPGATPYRQPGFQGATTYSQPGFQGATTYSQPGFQDSTPYSQQQPLTQFQASYSRQPAGFQSSHQVQQSSKYSGQVPQTQQPFGFQPSTQFQRNQPPAGFQQPAFIPKLSTGYRPSTSLPSPVFAY
jgi:hypothetical protein